MKNKEYIDKLECGIVNALCELADLYGKLGKEFDYVDKLCELTDLSNCECLNILDNGNMVQIVQDNLRAIRENKTNYDYSIYSDYADYKNYISIGTTKEERVQILIMLYVNKPKLAELKTWTFNDIISYIRETDTEYAEYAKYINECIELINEVQ